MLFYRILTSAMHGKIQKKSCKKSEFKISAPIWNEEFELCNMLYSVSDIQHDFEYILITWRKSLITPQLEYK